MGYKKLIVFLFIILFSVNCFSQQEEFNVRVEKWLRYFYNLTSDVKIEISRPKDSEFEGMKKIEVTFTRDGTPTKQQFFVTDDQQYLIIGMVIDLAKDPRKETLSKISIDEEVIIERGKIVTIIEYGDFQCPFSKKAYEVIEKILQEYKGKVRFIWKHFPLTHIHPWALQAAVCSQCAYQQRKEAFWNFYKYFFEKQDEITKDNFDKKITELVTKEKLDITEFNKCIGDRGTIDKIQKDINEALSLNMNATPTFVINGLIFPGVRSYEELKKIIDSELGK